MYNYSPIGIYSSKALADEEREESRQENFDIVLPGKIKTYTENIIIVGAEVHDKLPVNKLMFMAQAVRKVKLESIQTVLYFNQGYSSVMIAEFKKSLTSFKKNIKIIEITTILEVINYLNFGDVKGKSNIRTKATNNALFKVKNLYIYSHGMPSRITFLLDWELYKNTNRIVSSVKSEENELNLSNYQKISSNAFVREGYIWSFACRTAMGPGHDSDFELNWEMEKSLAQKLSNDLGVRVSAFLRRSSYEDTWGSREDRKNLKVGGVLNNIGIDIPSDDNFTEYKKFDKMLENKYHWNSKGAFRGVKAGSTPVNPPQGMMIFQKIN